MAVHDFTKRRPGASPGTLNPAATAPKPRVTVLAFGASGFQEAVIGDIADLDPILEAFPTVWIDVQGLGDIELLEALGARCGIHPLVLEDAVNVGQRAKIEEFEESLFFVLWMLDMVDGQLEREQLGIFVREGIVVTFQEHVGDCLDPLRERIRQGRRRVRKSGADYLTYAILDTVVDHYMPVLEELSEVVEDIEDRIVEDQSTDEAGSIHEVKRTLLAFRKLVWPLRDALAHALRLDDEIISEDTRLYLRDCLDHVMQVIDVTETYRELGTGLMDLHLSTISNRMNEVMKVLTIIATLFIPMTFISSIYGMNFDTARSPYNMPELAWRFGYPVALLLMFVFAACLLIWFRRKGWLGGRD